MSEDTTLKGTECSSILVFFSSHCWCNASHYNSIQGSEMHLLAADAVFVLTVAYCIVFYKFWAVKYYNTIQTNSTHHIVLYVVCSSVAKYISLIPS